VKATPTPPGPAVAKMPPFTFPRGSEGLKNSVGGRIAVYTGPIGLSVTTVASPRV